MANLKGVTAKCEQKGSYLTGHYGQPWGPKNNGKNSSAKSGWPWKWKGRTFTSKHQVKMNTKWQSNIKWYQNSRFKKDMKIVIWILKWKKTREKWHQVIRWQSTLEMSLWASGPIEVLHQNRRQMENVDLANEERTTVSRRIPWLSWGKRNISPQHSNPRIQEEE